MRIDAFLENLRSPGTSQAAQGHLYALLHERLLGRLKARLPQTIRARLDAEDVLHEAFLRALRNLDSVEIPSERALVAWVWRIATNLILDQIKRSSAGAVPLDAEARGGAARSSRLLARGRAVESSLQTSDWVDTFLGRLKPREAEVIRLHLLAGRSLDAIAAAWGRKPSTIKRLYSLALARLRETGGDGSNANA